MARGRDAALDNLKGLLIISVVYVHLYDMLGQKTPLLFTIRTIVLAVQMPLFLFLCGYFGKHAEKRRDAAWAEYLIPFLIFNTLYYLMRAGQEPGMKYALLRPLNMYWFLLTLLVIRVLMPELLRVRWLLPISLVTALLIGGDPCIGRDLSLSRTICFLPFYLLGYYCTPEQMGRIRKIPLPVAWVGAGAGAFLALWMTDVLPTKKGSSHPFQLVNSYARQGLTPWAGMEFRLAMYIAAPLLGILLLRIVHNRYGLLTSIGKGSMTVYMLHAFPMLWIVGHWGFVCKIINWFMPAFENIKYPGKLAGGVPQLIILILYSFLVSWVLSAPPVVRAYDRFIEEMKLWLFRATGKPQKTQETDHVQEN